MLPLGYTLQVGGWSDRALLRQFLELTYQELCPHLQDFSSLQETVDRFLSPATPLWLVESPAGNTIACLWLGITLDQSLGKPHSQIFVIYVLPEHRRLGIGKALIHQGETWAKERGDRQIGLQVFVDNQKAINLYQNLGYQTQSLLMIKSLA